MGDDLLVWRFHRRREARLIPEIAQLWLDSWRSSGTAAEEDVRVEDLIQRIRDEATDRWEVTLVSCGPDLAGFMALRPTDNCLDQLFIASGFKRAGFGSRLMEVAKKRFRHGMWLRTAEANHPARVFYEKHGFRHTETDEHPRLGYARVIYRWP